MESDYFDSALNSLKKPQGKRRLLQILIAIKKGVHDTTRNSERLRKLSEAGCTKNLLMCLQQENTNVVDVTLSIIGNCCVDPNFARDSIKLNILHVLNRVLEKHRESSVQGRVFRIVGNLCDNISSDLIIFKEPTLVDGVTNFLINTSKTDSFTCQSLEASIAMAVRSIRKLLRRSTISKLVMKHNILNAVGSVLLRYTQLWQETKKYELVLQDILRLLHAFSQYNHLLIPEVLIPLKRNAEKVNPLMCLAALVILNPSRVIKIVLNFSRLCILKSDLPISQIWDNLLAKVKSTSSDSVRKEYLKCMGDLADDPANREYLRLNDNVSQLVSVLRDFTTCNDYTMDCCSLILSILNKCQNDDLVIMKQIHCGTISVLTEKLEWICSESSCIIVPKHAKQKRKKRPLSRFTEKKFKASIGSPMDTFSLYLDGSLLRREERCDSPSECSEISSNGPYSPSCAAVAEDASDSDDYSPVCSDAEDIDVNALLPLGSVDADYIASSEDEDLNLLPDPNRRMKHKLLDEITTLLLRYIRVKPVVMELASPRLLMLLMNISVELNKLNSATQNILRLVARQEYLIPLMLTDFLRMIYDVTLTVHDATNCWLCYQVRQMARSILLAFASVAESGAGKGDIAHQLLRADVETKEKLVLSIPYTIRSKEIVSQLLLSCGGLDIFLKLMLGSSDLRSKSVKGLCVLAIHHLNIKNPVNSEKTRTAKKVFDAKSYRLSDTCENIVTFKLDDGSSIKADRDFLSENSDYFNRLLCGSFKESEQSEINLQNVTNKSFRCLLQLLQSDVTKMGVLSFNTGLETILELLELTERYLMVDLNVYLTSCVEQQHITSKTAPIIYQWSIESGTNILRVEVIAFALVADILDSERLIMFQNLFDLGYSEQLVDDIQKLLVRFLR